MKENYESVYHDKMVFELLTNLSARWNCLSLKFQNSPAFSSDDLTHVDFCFLLNDQTKKVLLVGKDPEM